jgi:hypothetical protein
LDKETMVKLVKEKGPTFAAGAIVGIALFMAFKNREQLTDVFQNVFQRKKSATI